MVYIYHMIHMILMINIDKRVVQLAALPEEGKKRKPRRTFNGHSERTSRDVLTYTPSFRRTVRILKL